MKSSLLVIFLFVIYSVQCCDKITFVNAPVAASSGLGVLESQVIPVTLLNGCLEPVDGLEEAVRISVFNSSTPLLYPEAVNNLPSLKILSLDSNGIKTISAGSFVNVPSLSVLTMIGNKVKSIPAGVFNGLNVSYLNLDNNTISLIDPTAFDDMPKLTTVSVQFNKISTWNPSWFTDSPNVVSLYFAHNKLASVPAAAFANLKGARYTPEGFPVVVTLDFSYNKISVVDPTAFDGLETIGSLDLRKNAITTLTAGTFSSASKIGTLILDENKIDCLTVEFLDSLPPVAYVSANGNSWNCTCLDNVKSWSKLHGGVINVQIDDINCTSMKMKGVMDFVSSIKDWKAKFATMKIATLPNATSATP